MTKKKPIDFLLEERRKESEKPKKTTLIKDFFKIENYFFVTKMSRLRSMDLVKIKLPNKKGGSFFKFNFRFKNKKGKIIVFIEGRG